MAFGALASDIRTFLVSLLLLPINAIRLRQMLFLTVSGKFLVTEIGVELPPGSPMGELGFLTPNNRRTATVECTEAAQVLTITYERLLELYFQNPQFGYYFLVVTSQRLLQNVARMEGIIEQNKMIIVRLSKVRD